MKSIYNYEVIPSQSSSTVADLTVTNSLTLQGATPNELLITDTGGLVTEFANGPANYLLEVGQMSGAPRWTNVILPDHVQTNTIGINGTQPGDIFQVDPSGNGNFARVPIGTLGQILKVGSGNTIGWGPLIVPDPLTVNDLVVVSSLKLGAGMGNGKMFIDGSNNVYAEADQVYNNNSVIAYSTSETVLFTNNSFQTYAGRRYSATINFENGNNYGVNFSTIKMYYDAGVVKQCVSVGPGDLLHFEYNFTASTTGIKTIAVTGQSSAGNSSATNCTIRLSPLSI
jgi:hypothetical protein